MKRTRLMALAAAVAALYGASRGQDSVDVTFRYTNSSVSAVNLVGDFQSPAWTNTDPAYSMTNLVGGLWTKRARLALGGNPSGTLHGSWQYKFFPAGTTGAWPNDPLNHHVNAADQGNTYLYTKDPTFYQVLPNQRLPVQVTSTPTLSAYIFPKVGAAVDTASIRLLVDGKTISGLGASFNPISGKLTYTMASPIVNGSHTMVIQASSSAGGSNADTVTFYTQSGFVLITNPGGYSTRTTTRTLFGIVQGAGVTTVKIVRNSTDTTSWPVISGKFTATIALLEGVNTFRALADSSGTQVSSSDVSFTRLVSHLPNALISFYEHGSIDLRATGSTSPDSGRTLSFIWGEDPSNPAPIGGVNGNTSPVITVNRPSVLGEYYFSLIATDTSGNSDTTRNYFTLMPTPPIVIPTIASVPRWVREGRMYTMYFKMQTASGTINAALPDLNRIAAMGYNILWILPVMKNRATINSVQPGYEIVDFYTVAPEFGTNQDMKNFISQAHALGMKVILDITPNHTSSSHPFVLDARTFGQASQYWSYYQHQVMGGGNLSQATTSDGFVYYNGFGDALLNYNWADIDARTYMIDVYKYWIQAIGADGYRLDVYWGPHARSNGGSGGEGEMGQPVRAALKHIRPDIALLGETDGTGVGTEVNFADQGGGLDEAYDWILKSYVQSNIWSSDPATRVNTLDGKLRNQSVTQAMGYLPGPNSYYLRFLENQDEDRIAYVYGNGAPDAATARARTMPVATAVNLAVGLPEVYAGQEVGRGPGISDSYVRRRGVIDFSDPAGLILTPHYQKLAQIKKQYPCFSTQSMFHVAADAPGVYAYTRPLQGGANGVVVANLDGAAHDANITLSTIGNPGPLVGLSDGPTYIATDLYNGNTTQAVQFTGGIDTLKVSLPAFGSAVYVIDNVAHTLILPSLTGIGVKRNGALPGEYALGQNYPNPFNPATTISYEIRSAGRVTLRVYDVLGREVATLVDGYQGAGTYSRTFDASGLSSGVYFYRLQAGTFVNTKKMVLAK